MDRARRETRGISRRTFLRKSAAAGAGIGLLATVGVPSNALAVEARILTPSFYDWMLSLFPIREVSDDWGMPVNVQQSPVEEFGLARFVAEAAEGESTWDIFAGMTPFDGMADLIQAGVLEPWDDYLPAELIDRWTPSVREEATFDGKIYSAPLDSSVVVSGWNGGIVERAGLDPDELPRTWDDWIGNARKVVESGAAPFGCTFDAQAWRSLVPITYSISLDVYRDDDYFDFTNDAVVEALEIMKRMMEYANPDVLGQGAADAGRNVTPDEGAFAAERVAYMMKHAFGPLNTSANWPDPSQLRVNAIPTYDGGAGGTAFWSTGAGLFKHGSGDKQEAADYWAYLTQDMRIIQADIAKDAIVGQLTPYADLWEEWAADPPEWLAPWAPAVHDQLQRATSIKTRKNSVQQFLTGRPHWETYLTGEESDPRKALQNAMDAVLALP